MNKSCLASKNWKKWVGKVMTSNKNIKQALKEFDALGREPKNIKELEDLIFKRENEKLVKDVKRGNESSFY